MPAFLRNLSCKVYFSLSPYNNQEDIKYAQISITYQNSNLSALDNKIYPNEIKVCDVEKDSSINSDAQYYVTIDTKDLKDKIFAENVYYKVQIRFTSIDAPNLIKEDNHYKATAAWLLANTDYFSEWSTVCLIRGISQPILKMADYITSGAILKTRTLNVLGSFGFESGSKEKETLKYYQISLVDSNNVLLEKTERIYTNILDPNSINYSLKQLLSKGETYKLTIQYMTKNLYEGQETFNLVVGSSTIDFKDLVLNTDEDLELGVIKININFNNFITDVNDEIWIKRTSMESDFQHWVYLHKIRNSEYKQLNYTWYDFTIESGSLYKYGIEVIKASGETDMFINNNPCLVILEDMYLMNDYTQLDIKLNPQVSSYQKIVNDNITTTLGSQFPFITRSGNTGYHQFSISGLISAQMDENEIFTNKDEQYGFYKDVYSDYNYKHKISVYKDFQYERKFREKVMNFLTDNTIKLFRSPTEGNLLVRLTNISFTPNQSLGRMLYSFSATATEIDKCTMENLIKYKVVDDKDEDEDIVIADDVGIYAYGYDETAKALLVSIDSISEDGEALILTSLSNEI